MTNPGPLDTVKAALAALAALPTDAAEYETLSNTESMTLAAALGDCAKLVGARNSVVAGVLARRSAPELGSHGLAQELGLRTPVELVQSLTGVTKREATTAVRIGQLSHEVEQHGQVDATTGEVFTASEPWMRGAVLAVARGELSIQTADAIRAGAGRPTDTVTSGMLSEVVERAIEFALTSDTDRVVKFTKSLRDQIDQAGAIERANQRHNNRAWIFTMHPDGSATSIIRHNIVSAAQTKDLWDRANSPKRVRFVDLGADADAPTLDGGLPVAAPALSAFDERRQRENENHDTVMGFILAGAAADPSRILGNTGAQITVLVTQDQLDKNDKTGNGIAFVDGQDDPISVATVKNLMSCGTVNRVVFDENGLPIEPGTDQTAEQRYFTAKQRAFLVAMFGGCAFGDCDRPASWTEAHHILWVKRDGGKTTVKNGILLCRHHHLLLHNNQWEIRRTGRFGEELWLVPPVDVDPSRSPQRMRYKSRAYQQLLASLPQHSYEPTAA
ncbi:MAG: HNH endonuclease [Glaciihabitans sp.]